MAKNFIQLAEHPSGMADEELQAALAAVLKEILRVCPDAQAEVEDPRERDPSVRVIAGVAEVIELARQRARGASRDQREAGDERIGSLTDVQIDEAHKAGEGASQYVFHKSGNVWKIAYEGTEFYLSDIYGLGYIHEMLLKPNHPLKPQELEIAVKGTPPSEPVSVEEREWLDGTTDGGNDYKQIDEDAKRNIEQEIDEWRRQKRLAEQQREQVTVAELEDKIEWVEKYLAGSLQLGGKPRTFVGEPEKARQRVQKNIKRAIKKMAEHSEDLAGYLDEHIETGYDLVYQVEWHNEIPWMLHDNA